MIKTMDKITINELCHFLPHKLMGTYQLSHVIKVPEHSDEIREKMLLPDSFQFFLNYCKPIVYPLSMLTQEITYNGEVIVPYYFIENKYDTTNWAEFLKQLQSDHNWIGHCDWSLMLHLLEWHFDVFNWIGRGLAIDKSTLNENNL